MIALLIILVIPEILQERTAAINAADAKAVEALIRHAKEAVAAGNLHSAADAWTAALELAPQNAEAIAFFRVIGKEVSEPAEPKAKVEPPKSRRIWRSTNTIFVRDRIGRYHEHYDGNHLIYEVIEQNDWVIDLKSSSGRQRLYRNERYSSSDGKEWWREPGSWIR